MRNQLQMFDIPKEYKNKIDAKYSSKIQSPIYEPSPCKPFVQELTNTSKSDKLIRNIEMSSVSKEEKSFLIKAAQRHIVFDYHKIADYYAHASEEMQSLMEDSALVIIDFKRAIELGYVNLSDEIAEQFMEDKDCEK